MTFTIIFLTLSFAGLLAGLVQYFVDYRGLPLYQPGPNPAMNISIANSGTINPIIAFIKRVFNFFRNHWQLAGYLVVGYCGAMLVPVLSKLIPIKYIQIDYSCLGNPKCPIHAWDVFVLFGLGIISGYSSVRLIRNIGALLISNLSKSFQEQQQSLEQAKKQIEELKAKVEAAGNTPGPNPIVPVQNFQMAPAIVTTQYFDDSENEINKKQYYSGIDLNNPKDLFQKTNALLTNTHTKKLPYHPSTYLYPLVDIYPDEKLRSVYNPDTIFDPQTLIAMDMQMDVLREKEWMSFNCLDMSNAQFSDELEKKFPYNCEHVVPQSWFHKGPTMQGDLHHLFSCEIKCNSFRLNYPYSDFSASAQQETQMPECGRLEREGTSIELKFEPLHNKGAVARAVLYFLIRYPGAIGNKYTAADIPAFISWHNNNKITLWELHRNQAIYQLQGNRNPFIDFPDLVNKIDFSQSFNPQPNLALQAISFNVLLQDDSVAFAEVNGANFAASAPCVITPADKWNVWRVANGLKALLGNVNAMAPGRNKIKDGTIGDSRHQTRDSDHNPWVWDDVAKKGVVTALDITHDPAGKCDCNALAQSLVLHKDDRIKYIIWNRRIANSSAIGGSEPWVWRPYDGENPHDKHIHISVKCPKDFYDKTDNWSIALR